MNIQWKHIFVRFLLLGLVACTSTQDNSTQSTLEPIQTVGVQPSEDAIRVGVLAIRSAEAVNTQYGGIIAYLEVDDIQYKPMPSWEFYSAYLKLLSQVKKEVNPSLSPNYAALSGFLMITM